MEAKKFEINIIVFYFSFSEKRKMIKGITPPILVQFLPVETIIFTEHWDWRTGAMVESILYVFW